MTKKDQAKSIAAKLSKIAEAQRVPYQSIATTFLLERLLVRLVSNAQLAKSLVFKGGYVGLRVYNTARYTVDLDALLIKSDVRSTLLKTAKAIESDIGDGAWFLLGSQTDLATQGEYGGVRQTFRAGIGEKPKSAKHSQIINFDIGIGDPVVPGPARTLTAELISGTELTWQVYPIETIVAEKFQTLVARGDDNSRAKDVFDLFYYLPKCDGTILREAINKCFAFRETEIPENPFELLSGIDTSLMKIGWPNAVASLQDPPTFDAAYLTVLAEIRKVFSTNKKRGRAEK